MKIPSPLEIQRYYAGVEAPKIDLEGWGSRLPIFEELVQEIRPQIIIEVGSYKGVSAIHLAELAEIYRDKRNDVRQVEPWGTSITKKNTPIVVCVDFWQDWLPAGRNTLLPDKPWHDPVPLYHQFLYNVCSQGCHDRIIPFRANSKDAAIALHKLGCIADLIYVDAGHDYDTVMWDLQLYWKLLRPGGIMFGHDIPMPDVKRAVCDFRIPFRIVGEHWVMEKKAA